MIVQIISSDNKSLEFDKKIIDFLYKLIVTEVRKIKVSQEVSQQEYNDLYETLSGDLTRTIEDDSMPFVDELAKINNNFYLKHILSACFIKQKKDTYSLKTPYSLDRFLACQQKKDDYTIEGKASYKLAFFGQTFGKHLSRVWTDEIDNRYSMPGKLIATPAVFFSGTIHGLGCCLSRHPISQKSHKKLVDNFFLLCQNYNAQKKDDKVEEIIHNILTQYSENTVSTSNGSEDLISDLKDDLLTFDMKLLSIYDYITKHNEKGFNKNNGKRLFCIINEEMKKQFPVDEIEMYEKEPSI